MRKMLYLLLGAAVLGACNSDDEFDETKATNMVLVKGDAQSAEPGVSLADSLTVRVTNLKGDPVSGVTVQWFVLTGGGDLSAPSSVTNAAGVAQVMFTLGPNTGDQTAQAVAGSLSGSPITFTATARDNPGGGGGGGDGPAALRQSGVIR